MNKDSVSDVKITLVTSVAVQDLKALYRDAGWWQDEYDFSNDFLEKIPEASALFAAAFLENRIIGMGRALSDLCSDAYIQDIAVLSAYRNKGIGTKIINFLIQELKNRGVDWIGLIGQPGTRSFYERLGFRQMPEHIPFKLSEV